MVRKLGKKGAMELSMSTIVILVLAMAMLGLGLFLVNSIFRGATESVDEINEKVKGEITSLFVDESSRLVVNLGADRIARIKADTSNFGVGFGAKTIDGSAVTPKRMKFKLSLDESSRENCVKTLGTKDTENLFKQTIGANIEFDRFEGDTAYAIVQLDVPEATPLCAQKVFIDVTDNNEVVGREVFVIEIIRKGFF
tara:strand:+ start:117 stop:707 length:591 start_codon:yes stop_codon:yes gene_type:complete